MMKLRKTKDRSVTSMLLEPHESLKRFGPDELLPESGKWRHMTFVHLLLRLLDEVTLAADRRAERM